ncbi:MAG: APC family permease [Fimbriimonadaceae bacterium]
MSWLDKLKRLLIGKPIHSKFAQHERLAVFLALPVFASDALSSTAYASEEVLLVLQGGGADALKYLFPIGIALVCLLWIVVFSYFQTIHAYPQGGGSYRVSSENLGTNAGLMAGSALLIGYILTVAVSVAAGAQAIIAMAPSLQGYGVHISVLAISVITILNLRGAKESGIVFAVPTYSFVVVIFIIIGIGLYQWLFRGVPQQEPVAPVPEATTSLQGALFVFFLLKAFAAGCTALTGTEAIADGVLAFKAPEAHNAAKTLVLMAALLSLLFLGINFVAQHWGILPKAFDDPEYKPVLAQIAARLSGGDDTVMFFVAQIATATILFLAANTGYADFPRLSMFIARDGFLPRQLTSVGDRLVFQNGIVMLALFSIGLIVLKNADTHQLIPLYAVGVFFSFTLSQTGMVAWWYKQGRRSWKKWVSAVGALVTGGVTLSLLWARWGEGAWITVVAIIVVVLLFKLIRRHYDHLGEAMSVQPSDSAQPMTTTVLLLVPRMHKGILGAIAYARTLTDDFRAVHVTLDPESAKSVKEEWARRGEDIPLVILDSPYRSLIQPIVEYVDQTLADNDDPQHSVTVIVPEAVPKNRFQSFLHANIANGLKKALGARRNVVITNVRYFLQ